MQVHHNHDTEISWGKRLLWAMAMNFIIPVVQIIGGVISGSMALISDALHNLSDFTSLLISYIALRIGQRAPTHTFTFGFKRVEVIAAVFNVTLLFAACFYISYEGWIRFNNPRPIQGEVVIWVALIALAANSISVLILFRGAKENLNLRSAFLHLLSDAVVSLAVVLLGILWTFKPWYWLDPVVSWIIVLMILYGGWDILKRAYNIVMNATPPGIDLEAIRHEIISINGIEDMHHMHAWEMTSEHIALAAHLIVPDQMLSSVDELAHDVREILYCKFGIGHPILQFETEKYEDVQILCDMEKYKNRKEESLIT